MGNKVKFGLRNVHYAKVTGITNGVMEYATPVAIAGAVNLAITPKGDKSEFYADDTLYYTDTPNQGYEGDFEIAMVPDQFLLDCMGYVQDTNGGIGEVADAKTSDFALLFEIDGDAKKRRHVLYQCVSNRPGTSGASKTASIEPQTDSLTITAKPRETDRKVKWALEYDAAVQTEWDAWFSSVYEPTLA